MKNIVSIIVPLYNREKFIGACIDSIIGQTNANWEVIVVDDGSVDQGPEIIAAYAKDEGRVKYYNNNSGIKGPSKCRNIGVEQAQGKYLMFLDSDDYLLPHCIDQRINAIERSSEDFLVYNIGMKKLEENSVMLFNTYCRNKDEYLDEFLSLKTPWAICCPIWKTSYFKKYGMFNEDFLVKTDPELHTRVC